ncbi:hypothetical protein OAD85_08315 [Actinomycetota bacterium]|nr:hypothetical protein [Actinomycetota bacterium]
MKFEVMWNETTTTTFLANVEAEDQDELTEMIMTKSHDINYYRDFEGNAPIIEILSIT